MKRKKELSNIEDKEVQFVKSILTQEDVNKLFEYRDGNLYWKIDIYSGKGRLHIKAGVKAGGLSGKYKNIKMVRYKGKGYHISRLIFLMFKGYLPKFITYKDKNSLNTKLENLLEANSSQLNIRQKVRSATGYKGVYFYGKKYVAQIKVNNKTMNLGYYNTAEEASKVYGEARIKYRGTFLDKCKVTSG